MFVDRGCLIGVVFKGATASDGGGCGRRCDDGDCLTEVLIIVALIDADTGTVGLARVGGGEREGLTGVSVLLAVAVLLVRVLPAFDVLVAVVVAVTVVALYGDDEGAVVVDAGATALCNIRLVVVLASRASVAAAAVAIAAVGAVAMGVSFTGA